jgi:hypothetical protein
MKTKRKRMKPGEEKTITTKAGTVYKRVKVKEGSEKQSPTKTKRSKSKRK